MQPALRTRTRWSERRVPSAQRSTACSEVSTGEKLNAAGPLNTDSMVRKARAKRSEIDCMFRGEHRGNRAASRGASCYAQRLFQLRVERD
eukprot:260125-Pelagomonas_calceolata.AAC.2